MWLYRHPISPNDVFSLRNHLRFNRDAQLGHVSGAAEMALAGFRRRDGRKTLFRIVLNDLAAGLAALQLGGCGWHRQTAGAALIYATRTHSDRA